MTDMRRPVVGHRDASARADHVEASRGADVARPALLNAQLVLWHRESAFVGRGPDMLVQMVSAAMGAGFAVSMWTMLKRMRDITR